MEKIKCGRCGGSGRFSFNLKDGDRCYGCGGSGFVMVDPVKHAKAQQRKAEREEKIKAEIKLKAEEANKRYEQLHEKYKDDPRLGSAIRNRMEKYEAVRFDVYQILERADSKGIHPETILHLAKNEEILLNVPFKEKGIAKKLGAKWNPTVKSWYWPESNDPLPPELEKFRID